MLVGTHRPSRGTEMDPVGNTGEGGGFGEGKKGGGEKGRGWEGGCMAFPNLLHFIVLKENHLLVIKGHDQRKS